MSAPDYFNHGSAGRLAPPADRWGVATEQFKEQVDAAFATMQMRDEAKAA